MRMIPFNMFQKCSHSRCLIRSSDSHNRVVSLLLLFSDPMEKFGVLRPTLHSQKPRTIYERVTKTKEMKFGVMRSLTVRAADFTPSEVENDL